MVQPQICMLAGDQTLARSSYAECAICSEACYNTSNSLGGAQQPFKKGFAPKPARLGIVQGFLGMDFQEEVILAETPVLRKAIKG